MLLNQNEIDETALWSGIRNGNQVAFEKLYKLYFRTLYCYGKKICHQTNTVEDAIHDLFLDLWKYRENLSTTTSIKFYLFRSLRRKIVKNENTDIASVIFDFRDEEIFVNRVLSYEADLVKRELEAQQVAVIKRQLHNLSPRHFESLILRFYDEFSYQEIGALLEVNEQSARNIVQRALQQLRHFMKVVTSLVPFLFGFLLS